jgi:hypothetical protein
LRHHCSRLGRLSFGGPHGCVGLTALGSFGQCAVLFIV